MAGRASLKRVTYVLLRAMLAFVVLATFGLLGLMAWHFKPLSSGTSAEFWEYLCGVQLPEFKGHVPYSWLGGVYPVVDGEAYYYAQEHHGSILFAVPLAEVLRDLPRVQDYL